MRVRGLKLPCAAGMLPDGQVAPHAGAWIEIDATSWETGTISVAPHAGAWIEIWSRSGEGNLRIVAPHAGAWIEIECFRAARRMVFGRTPCGCVD